MNPATTDRLRLAQARDRLSSTTATFAPLSQQLTDRWREFAGGRAASVTCFCWAVGEATLWPVIPDVALFTLTLAAPRRAPRLLLATVAGALVGGTLTVVAAALAPQPVLEIVRHVPLVHGTSVPIVRRELATMPALPAFLYQPWSGIPFKLWAVLAAPSGKSPAVVIPCFVLGRSLRFAMAALVGAGSGTVGRNWLRSNSLPLLVIAGPAAAYVFYRAAVVG